MKIKLNDDQASAMAQILFAGVALPGDDDDYDWDYDWKHTEQNKIVQFAQRVPAIGLRPLGPADK